MNGDAPGEPCLYHQCENMCVYVRAVSYVGVNFGVAHSEGPRRVQQEAAVSRALVQLFVYTHRAGDVGIPLTPDDTQNIGSFSD